MAKTVSKDSNWRAERKVGVALIAASLLVSAGIGYVLYRLLPALAGMDTIAARMMVALKCLVAATLFCFVGGIEAVAHERLRGPAFDPLTGFETKRLRVNLRYLQNTLEQLIVFGVGLFGLAAYLTNGGAMRILPVATVLWIINRYAFWIGYHRSGTMRGLGAPSMALGLVMLLYVAARIGNDVAGPMGAAVTIGLYLALEAILFWRTG